MNLIRSNNLKVCPVLSRKTKPGKTKARVAIMYFLKWFARYKMVLQYGNFFALF